ncbi:zinc finger protein 536-like [Acipenser oxyrinchus oxyrinchus]|uniref:Zinc finger protein 536-like n=1 Tax=Acipenser oxyrinchus oxyrinchus TaxID=40147 RepID=A0AAD8D9A2_ACIOX|nr:zinc finger protein 536-like [Acipenser oxyrinchus oxyrinchus]
METSEEQDQSEDEARAADHSNNESANEKQSSDDEDEARAADHSNESATEKQDSDGEDEDDDHDYDDDDDDDDEDDDESRDQMQTESAAKDSLGLMSSMSLEKQWQGMNLLSSQGVPPGVVKPEQAHLEQQMNMLSVLRTYSTENLAAFNGLGNSSNTTGGIKRPDLPAQRPFQCRYCPYSASQKGNLKTHVLCVHRMPFDNSQYPDRRFKRSRVDSDTSGNSEDMNTMTPGSSGENTPEAGRVQE